jgi:DNA replication ATP-dependent helicase Dna2
MSRLEVDQIRAMPVHEREARFKSARLELRLTGNSEQQALAHLGLAAQRGRRVYRLAPGSIEIAAREGDIAWALAPAGQPGFLDLSFSHQVRTTQILVHDWEQRWTMEQATAVSVAGLDRDARLIVVDETVMKPGILDDLERHGVANLTNDVVLDPIYLDLFHKKLRDVLAAIGTPAIALANPLALRATGMARRRAGRGSAHTNVADLLWNPRALEATVVPRNVVAIRAALHNAGVDLNPSQWNALDRALTRRLHLIWGPPGSGKSQTLVTLIVGACLDAAAQNTPLRILVSAFTWAAIDNVLLACIDELTRILPGGVHVARVRSTSHALDLAPAYQFADVELARRNPSQAVQDLKSRLANSLGIVLVGTTAHQVHNLMQVDSADVEELFDLIVLDEGSQLDVAHALVTLASLAAEGSVVCAGDWLQLAPIHQAEPPLGLEHMVGSIYRFFRDYHGIGETLLNLNYRSNETIVGFSRYAGYGPALQAHSPDLRLRLLSPLPGAPPPNWPADLHWTPEWSAPKMSATQSGRQLLPPTRCTTRQAFGSTGLASLRHTGRSRVSL